MNQVIQFYTPEEKAVIELVYELAKSRQLSVRHAINKEVTVRALQGKRPSLKQAKYALSNHWLAA